MSVKNYILGIVALGIIILNSCATSNSTAKLYSEQSIPAEKVRIRTVAVIPNRMPMTMQDPEKWRQYNWKIISDIFTAKGFRVIDYNTTVNLFTRSGLPLEDTKSSRDKYADFANEINAELVVIPYYGTSYNLESGFFNNTHKYLSIGSLQFYYAPQNDFIARIDFEGSKLTTTSAPGTYAFFGLLPTLIRPEDPEDMATIGMLTGLGSLMIMFSDLLAPTNPQKNWESSFQEGIVTASNVFFNKYSPSYGYSEDRVPQRRGEPAGQKSQYASFSIEELELLKKNAVDKKDFKKAAEIKAEIDSRKK